MDGVKVSVTITVECDAAELREANGLSADTPASEVRQAVKEYIGNGVQQLSMFEEASAEVRWR